MWTVDKIRFILSNAAGYTLVNSKRIRNSFIIYRFLQGLFALQTADEQDSRITNNLNSVGFTAFDASFLSEIAVKSADYMRNSPNDYGLNVFWGVFSANKAKAANLTSPRFQTEADATDWAKANRPTLFPDTVFVLAGGQAAMVGSMLVKYAKTQLPDIALSGAAARGGEQTCEPEGYVAPEPRVKKTRKAKAEVETKCPDCGEGLDLDHTGCHGVQQDDRNGGFKPVQIAVETMENDVEAKIHAMKSASPENYYMDGELDEREAHAYWSERLSRQTVGGRR
jgi:hypothetical protein